jgi:hypothetical protein
MAPLTVFLDANVLYPAGLRDLFMRLALQGLFRAKWSKSMWPSGSIASASGIPLKHLMFISLRYSDRACLRLPQGCVSSCI